MHFQPVDRAIVLAEYSSMVGLILSIAIPAIIAAVIAHRVRVRDATRAAAQPLLDWATAIAAGGSSASAAKANPGILLNRDPTVPTISQAERSLAHIRQHVSTKTHARIAVLYQQARDATGEAQNQAARNLLGHLHRI